MEEKVISKDPFLNLLNSEILIHLCKFMVERTFIFGYSKKTLPLKWHNIIIFGHRHFKNNKKSIDIFSVLILLRVKKCLPSTQISGLLL